MNDLRYLKDKVIEEIELRKDELIDLCCELIRFPSENPPGNSEPISKFIATYLDQFGISTTWHEAAPGMWNLISRVGDASSGKTLVLCGHTDVVPAGDLTRWKFDPYAGIVEEGGIYGRGASDMKCGLAGLIFTVAILQQLGIQLSGQLVLAIVPDEETGGALGVPWLLKHNLLAGDGCIISEPAFPHHPTIGQKGCTRFRVTVQGASAHAAVAPLAGTNAILIAMKAIEHIVSAVSQLSDGGVYFEHIKLMEASKIFLSEAGYQNESDILNIIACNVGTIQGGVSVNMVPDQCVFEMDCRIPFGLTRELVLRTVRKTLEQLGCEYDMALFGVQSDPNYTSPDDPVCKAVTEAITYVSEGSESFGVLQWAASDARHFRDYGIPVLQYGPAYLPSIHSYNEKAPVEDVIRCAKVYAAAAIDFLRV